MATIALYANKVNQMPELVQGIKSAVNDYKTELQMLQIKALSVGVSVCDLNDVISSIQSSTQTQEEKVSSFDTFEQNTEEFILTAASVDSDVADVINQQRAEFYEEYAYLQPECEKNAWDKFCDKCKSVGEWCKEHWVEIFVTITLVVGAVFAIAAVLATGGVALVPLLTTILTSLGMATGMATTIATVTSFSIAAVALFSTIASTVLNIIDTWCDMSKDATFKSFQKVMNWMSAISNGLYSIGSIFNGFKGITNGALKEYSKIWRNDSAFREGILRADSLMMSLEPNSTVFWTGMFTNGKEHVAKNYIKHYGGSSLETILQEQGVLGKGFNSQMFDWKGASSSLAMNSSGQARVLVGLTPSGTSIWNTTERILLNINPNITSIKTVVGGGLSINFRIFEVNSVLSGTGSLFEAIMSLSYASNTSISEVD